MMPTKTRPARTVYIAGPMTGLADFNYPTFNAWENVLKMVGWQVLNPAKIGEPFGTAEEINANPKLLKAVINAELAAVAGADAIFLLEGWEKSAGARRELAVALNNGLIILTNSVMSPEHYAIEVK